MRGDSAGVRCARCATAGSSSSTRRGPSSTTSRTDPFEEHDLSAARPGLVNAMRAALPGFDAETGREPSDATPSAAAAPDVRARLAALGYTSGTTTLTPGQGRDPKDHIEEFNAARRTARQ